MQISLRSLGSKALQDQIIKDIEDLMRACKHETSFPLHLVIGPLFLRIHCVQILKDSFSIKDWDYQIKNNYQTISEMYTELLLTTYLKCEEKDGVFDKNKSLTVFFDPEEEYLALYTVNLTRKADKDENKTKDGHPIELLTFEPEDILSKFNGEFLHH